MVAVVAIWPVIWVIVKLSKSNNGMMIETNNKLAKRKDKHNEKISTKRNSSIRSSSNR